MEVEEVESIQLAQAAQTDRLPRGATPQVLLQQIRNTAPFVFDEDFVPSASSSYEYLHRLRGLNTPETLPHLNYFLFCLSAHHATVGTYVPTDVDNQIRFKLWHPALPTEVLVAMSDAVLRSHQWDSRPVTTRFVSSEKNPSIRISGHDGEWLSTAAGAYASLRKRAPEKAAEVAAEIIRELYKEADLYLEARAAKNGIALLKIATLIAHNLGDLDRVIELWNIPDEDPLKVAVYKAGHSEKLFGGVLYSAGKLNKDYMAIENHRHFALRAARPLRKSSDLLLPIGPFFDDWGTRLAHHPGLSLEEKGLVAETLVDGWEKLSAKGAIGPVGYARALAGILENFPGGFQNLAQYIPAKLSRTLKAGPLRSLCAVPKNRFEEQWSQMALKHVVI